MPAFEVKIPGNTPGLTLKNGHDVMSVFAEDAADALRIAGGHFDGDSEGAWASATATEIVAAADLGPVANAVGGTTVFALQVTVKGPDLNQTYKYTAIAADVYDDVFNAMVLLLNADPSITGAAFAADLLTISDIGDALGDHTVTAEFTYGGVAIPSYLSTITHEGIAAAVLSIATNATEVLAKVQGTSQG